MAFEYKPFEYFNPKQQMRYVLFLTNVGVPIPTYMVKTADRPVRSSSEASMSASVPRDDFEILNDA